MVEKHLHPWVARLHQRVTTVENAVLIVLLGIMVVLAGSQILARNLFGIGLPEGDQVVRLLVLWVALLGAVAASRDDRHINIDVLARWLSLRGRLGARLVVDAFTSGVSGLIAWHAARFVAQERAAGTTLLAGALPAWTGEVIIPAAFGMMALRYALHFFHHFNELRLAGRT